MFTFRILQCRHILNPWCEGGVRYVKLISDMVKIVYISEMQPLPQELAFGIELRAKAKILRLISKRCIAQTKLQLQIKQNLDA